MIFIGRIENSHGSYMKMLDYYSLSVGSTHLWKYARVVIQKAFTKKLDVERSKVSLELIKIMKNLNSVKSL